MTDLPSGTVTFLYTDLEGSTALWEQHPQTMQAAVARHDALLRNAVADHQGHVFRTTGDGLCAAFATAPEAVAAALAAQVALHAEAWGEVGSLRVRMALHTGTAEVRAGDYVGTCLNRIGRLLATGHGGQTLFSQTTADLARGALPERASLRELGEHRLRDLVQPERLYQLLHPALPADFPPLHSLDVYRHNLPLQVTSFVGRERAMATIIELLGRTRLLTLTGTGGAGKTRLALQVAAELVDDYPDGVWLVELATLADPVLVPQSVATALGVREQPGRPLLTTLVAALASQRALLLLDSCEHLIDAAAQVADSLIRGCRGVQVVATSREALGLAGELAWRVPSLTLPAVTPPTGAVLLQAEAAQLFVERARFARPDFSVADENVAAVAEVCQRLDGIPLAIELAAARVTVLSVEHLARRLDDRFRLLTAGSRTALPRQQTLRATIDWSHDLLTEPERVLLRRLSVFAGGWTLAAAEAVCADDDIDGWEVLDLLARLVDKSLVLMEAGDGGEERYRLLETIRQYAGERLAEVDEARTVRDRHRDWYVTLAARAEPALRAADQLPWLARLEAEHDNLRAALTWCLDRDPHSGLRLANSLWHFWHVRSHFEEGRRWLERMLAQAPERTQGRAMAMLGLGILARGQGDLPIARSRLEESLALSRELGDMRSIAWSLCDLSYVLMLLGDYGQARVLLEEGLAVSRAVGQPLRIGVALSSLGRLAEAEGDYRRARTLLEESLTIAREVGDRWTAILALRWSGNVALSQGRYEQANILLEEGLVVAQELGSTSSIAVLRYYLGNVASCQGDSEQAVALYEGSLALARQLDDRVTMAWDLAGLGRLAHWQNDAARAIVLLRESLALSAGVGYQRGISAALYALGLATWSQGDSVEAMTNVRESLLLCRELADRPGIAECLEGLATMSVGQGQPRRAARLLGVATALRDAMDVPRPPREQSSHEAIVRAARATLGEMAFAAAWAAGQAMTLEEAIASALAEEPDPVT